MKTTIKTYEFFASCGRGLEGLLAKELRGLAIKRVRPLSNGVAFFGSIEDGMRACLWLRTASRVLLILDRVAAKDSDTLYSSLHKIPWENHIATDGSFAIDAYGRNDSLRNSQFIAVRAKDAIVDRLRSKDEQGRRPNIQRERPNVLINVNLRGEKATIALDLSGEPLHRRGYRVESRAIKAPLKENLAAAMLLAAGWDSVVKNDVTRAFLLDPFCGSGTIVIEAALMASDRAPGLLRDYWGFSGWLKHDKELWFKLLDEADERAAIGTENLSEASSSVIVAGDSDMKSLQAAVESAKRANLSKFINFKGQLAPEDTLAFCSSKKEGILVTNPPYGQRLSSEAQLPAVYAELTSYIVQLTAHLDTTTVAVISPDRLSETYITRAIGRSPFTRLKAMNGPLESDIRVWKSADQSVPTVKTTSETFQEEPKLGSTGATKNSSPLVDATPFTNRLAKMAKHRKKWARRTGISCYRVYDADLPDFNVAVDFYQGAASTRDSGKSWLHIAEYKAPKEVDENLVHARLAEILRVAPAEFNLQSKDVYLKQRRQAKGGSQYHQGKDTSKGEGSDVPTPGKLTSNAHLVNEGGLTFEVDLSSKLDTGIFLDHRNVRSMLREKAQGRDCLNLFAYTGTASVYMADGGANSVTTLDLSSTYLEWAQRNMKLNKLLEKPGLDLRFEKADALRWLVEQRALRKPSYDLIFVDVPTFSNSAKMGKRSWDVQRDHVELLINVSRLLKHGGEALFSTNLRSFTPNLEALAKARVSLDNISKQTIPADFERSPNIHHSFILRKLPMD
ncbi:MAG: bifunctional 23S rRNA (guanine(2069)-N(7))-methyltransferase RlmK/23S rRNA (guanine(2445)-N(2))-methyltransferase RlmL [Coriobacteriia bacterium]|nr:bifunctional 23S rRNA (guanine(2069)-N(7))-methyltransferase RlmK/23S rRNA (guanine(2445)-N(2))-methyltransferase RlmL [Coriobacteriia bacterium]MCL2870735.1 bifunctional 23S rRNA (guanine(2069)-N(7))-methyltransferase RlmK/23S rRNA (guanine(2445)-N(2))-methyltransferase RlmL [Coriobacteriia bacterium]